MIPDHLCKSDELLAKGRLDEALERLRGIGHAIPHTPETANLRWLVEWAAAFVREAWIAADGQRSARPQDVAERMSQSQRMLAAIHAKAVAGAERKEVAA